MSWKWIDARVDGLLRAHLIDGEGVPSFDFAEPSGEPALAGPDSVSWRVFRHPLSLYLGGITAVLLELAEPRVRSGVWDHTTFRTDPIRRMRRTGLAAMVTVYGARTMAEKMIAGVGRMHGRIEGVTPDGVRYRADDPELLRWVHATALFGFMEAYHCYVKPLSQVERDRFVAEGVAAARLYGAETPPASEEELRDLFQKTLPSLQTSGIVREFLGIMQRLVIFPRPLRPVARLLVRAAVDLLPGAFRELLELDDFPPPSRLSKGLIGWAARWLDGFVLKSMPAAQSCRRMGLPIDYLVGK